jgi:hypothetical protein
VAGGFQRKEDVRTKVFAITSGAIIVYRLPKDLEVERLRLERVGEHGLYLVDGAHFKMDLAERMAHRTPAAKAG